MLIFLKTLFRPLECPACWRRDPLSHPDIAAMDERARADLPFDPSRVDPC
ncbi:hypothetical protein [Paracoccus pacificus]|uniref:Uncharacterized protein n=1 Tax=Paracoccus pacificus TaxID=1463598 RepID=A0ABW4RC04_9RHOB